MPHHTLALEDLSREEEEELNLAIALSRAASVRRSPRHEPHHLALPPPKFTLIQTPTDLYERNAPPSPFIYRSPQTATGQRTPTFVSSPARSRSGSFVMIRPKEPMAPFTIEMQQQPQIQIVPIPVERRRHGCLSICAIILFMIGIFIFITIVLHFFIFKFHHGNQDFEEWHDDDNHHHHPVMQFSPVPGGYGLGSGNALFGNGGYSAASTSRP